jgi:hypothetical protein
VSAKYGNELTVEFLCGTNMATASNLTMVGSKRLLTFAMKTGDGATGVATYINSQTALMTQLQLSGSVGELMRGSASFKISGR